MKSAVIVLALLLALTANLVLPRTAWVNATCCHSSLSISAPAYLDFCSDLPTVPDRSGQLRVEAPNCCTTTPITLSLNLPTATPPAADQALPAMALDAVLAMPSPAPRLTVIACTPVQSRFTTGPPGAPDLPVYLVHTRLNL